MRLGVFFVLRVCKKGSATSGPKMCINILHIRHGLHRNVLWEKVFDIVNGGEWTMDDIEMMIQVLV